MTNVFPQVFENQISSTQRLSRIYAVYRIALAIIMATLFLLTINSPLIGADEPLLYAMTVVVYFFIAVLAYIFLRSFSQQTNLQNFSGLIVDVIAFSLMLFANGGPNIQMSMLYLVTVVAAFILLGQRQAIFITLFAVVCVIYQQFYYSITRQMNVHGFSNVALLSLSFLGTGLLSNMMTRRLRSVEFMAEQQAKQVAKLNTLNQRIIETMENGVVILDDNNMITLINHAAQKILGLSYISPARAISETDDTFAQTLLEAIQKKRSNFIFTPNSTSRIQEALSVSIYYLVDKKTGNNGHDKQTLFFIEKVSKSQQQAQQMKLASLGRLTASIAHEIRNPIGAISQASQLLQEEPDDANQPIYEIIHNQTKRVSQIIEDVLQLSRQQHVQMDTVDLACFIPDFVAEHFPEDKVDFKLTQQVQIAFNYNQLEQVLVNLVENGLKHGNIDGQAPKVRVLVNQIDNYVHIDIIDNGAGVSDVYQEQLFEPFFTTAKTGTGLGLYLSRAFCEANGASLTYIASHSGACFRIAKLVE